MSDDLHELEDFASALLGQLSAPQRRALARKVAVSLRRSTQERIARQVGPDGTPYTPRKPKAPPRFRSKKGAIRRRKTAMFTRLRMAKWLKVKATADSAEVGFMGHVARLARVHQEGLNDRAERNGPSIRYAARPLLGFDESQNEMVRETVLDHLRAAGLF